MKREQHLGMWLTAGAALLLYYLSKNGLLHQSVTSSILTPDRTSTVPDPLTGAPQFDMGNAFTVPPGFSSAVPPIDASTGIATTSPGDPTKCSCPQGYSLWHNVNPDTYWCIPIAASSPANPSIFQRGPANPPIFQGGPIIAGQFAE